MAFTKNFILKVGGTAMIVVANYSALPDPTTVSGKFYWVSNSQGTSWLPGILGGTYYNSGTYYSNGTTWEFINVPYQATQDEVDAGLNNDKFVTPLTLKNGPINDATQTALNLKADKATTTKTILLDTTPLGTAVTGANNTKIESWLIPANTFVDGAKYDFEGLAKALSLNSTKAIGFYINTSDSMSGATQIGRTTSYVLGADYLPLKRQYVLRSGNLIAISTDYTNPSDESIGALATNLFQSFAFNPAVDNYFLLALVTANGADTFNLHSMEITETLPKTTI